MMSEFFAMGGYASFVWSSYGLAAVVLWLNWYLPRRTHRRVLRQLKRRHLKKSNFERNE
jgi:heme exporter protein D